ncbi:MAG: Uma2 family endonuclease [Cyanobacteria bacterium J06648_16]
MIAAQSPFPQLTPDEYLAWEAQQPEKHEYIDGQIYAMGGGTVSRGRIAIRLTSLVDGHLSGTKCIPGNSDIKISIPGTGNYTYSDASVTCDDRDQTATQFFTHPCLIVEVLSDSTEAYDRGGKFRLYRLNPVLQEYLLVSSTRLEIDLYRKNDAGEWVIVNYQPGDTVALRSINLSFPIEQVYEGLTLTSPQQS